MKFQLDSHIGTREEITKYINSYVQKSALISINPHKPINEEQNNNSNNNWVNVTELIKGKEQLFIAWFYRLM